MFIDYGNETMLDLLMLSILLISRIAAAYSVIGIMLSAGLVVTGHKNATKWSIVFSVLLIRNVISYVQTSILPVWFIAYSTIPLIACSLFEDMAMYVTSDKVTQLINDAKKAPHTVLRWKIIIYEMIHDTDIAKYYASGFECYMIVCSLVVVEHHCVTLDDTVLFAGIWSLFTITEHLKTARYTQPFVFPSHIVKTIYIIYAPSRFWGTLCILSLINIWLIGVHKSKPVGQIVII